MADMVKVRFENGYEGSMRSDIAAVLAKRKQLVILRDEVASAAPVEVTPEVQPPEVERPSRTSRKGRK